jgi:thymidine kinase
MASITNPSDRPQMICANCQNAMSFENRLEMEAPRRVKAEHIHNVMRSGTERWSAVCSNCGHYTVSSAG